MVDLYVNAGLEVQGLSRRHGQARVHLQGVFLRGGVGRVGVGRDGDGTPGVQKGLDLRVRQLHALLNRRGGRCAGIPVGTPVGTAVGATAGAAVGILTGGGGGGPVQRLVRGDVIRLFFLFLLDFLQLLVEGVFVLVLPAVGFAQNLRRGGVPAGQTATGVASGHGCQAPGNVQTGLGLDFVAQRDVPGQVRQHEAGDVVHGVGLPDNVALVPGPVLGIGGADDRFAAPDGLGFDLAGDGVRHGALYHAFQHEDPGGPAVDDFNPPAGAPDAHRQSGGADVHGFVVLQGLGYVEEEVAV